MRFLFTLLCWLFLLVGAPLWAQPYQVPEPALTKIVDQPSLPAAGVSPDFEWVVFFRRPGHLSLAEMSGPELKLAGVRFDPLRHAPSRRSGFDQVSVLNLKSGESWVAEGLPKEAKIVQNAWSPDGKNLALVIEESQGLSLWLLPRGEKRARHLATPALNGVLLDDLCRWSADGRHIYTAFVVPEKPPVEQVVPLGPVIQETTGSKAPVRTYQDLLRDESDARLFAHYARSQMAKIKLDGSVKKLGTPDTILDFSPSPDGNFILQQTIEQPYSFLVPVSRFAGRYSLLDGNGKTLKTLAEYPASENLPKGFDAVKEGPRSMRWRADQPATLVWVEALDGGDMSNNTELHDRVFSWAAPFAGEPRVLLDLSLRFRGLSWGHEELALVSEWRFSDRKFRTWKFNPKDPTMERVLLEDRSYNDRYSDPGSPLKRKGPYGIPVLATTESGSALLLSGVGASPKGNIPFLDHWDWRNGEAQRVWRSEDSHYERVLGLLDPNGDKLLTLRESPDEAPNFFCRSLADEELSALSNFAHPTPEFKDIQKELLRYKRSDGVELSGTLYLPAGYDGGRLPVLMWAYPREFKDAGVAGQVTDSPKQFKRVSYWGPLPFLALGYAVFDGPTMPIVGEGDRLPNDTFREQLVASAEAAVDILVKRGVADPERVAIGGHSYGAFMVANLLAHSDLFKTGIARSGAYNRSLTPFGFQGEERDFWEAQTVYSAMSPFFHAEKINEPMLLIHGAEDNNSGTYPLQSERMFAALKGLGGKSRFVMLPKESHGYKARESLLHMLWEEQEWLKKHL